MANPLHMLRNQQSSVDSQHQPAFLLRQIPPKGDCEHRSDVAWMAERLTAASSIGSAAQ